LKINNIVILIVILFIVQILYAQEETITVSTNDEFMSALGSNRTIILTRNEYIFPDRIDVKNVNNLSIIGKELTQILVTNRKATVVGFTNCENLILENLYIGHKVPPGASCDDERGTVMFQDCINSKITNSTFYGCGKVGLKLYSCENLTFDDFTIKECSESLFGIYNSKNIIFESSIFKDTYRKSYNNKAHLSYIKTSADIIFNNCKFMDNVVTNGNFIFVDNFSPVSMVKPKFFYNIADIFCNKDIELIDPIFEGNGFEDKSKKVTININDEKIDIGTAAAEYGIKEIEKLLDLGADINEYTKTLNGYTTPLMIAYKARNRKNLIYLLSNGANIYQKLFNRELYDEDYYTAEIYTILHKCNVEFLMLLNKDNINFDVHDEYGGTPLFYAVLFNDFDKVRYLVERGANINTSAKSWSTLGYPAYRGNLIISKFLIDNGANVNYHLENGYSPLLHCAKSWGDGFGPYDKEDEKYQITKYLIEKGASINYKVKRWNHNGYEYESAIKLSNKSYTSKMCEYLLEVGAEVKHDSLNWTIVHDIALRGSNFALEKLKNDNYNLLATNSKGLSILSGAVKNNDFQLIKHLLNNGIDINECSYGDYRDVIGPVIVEVAARNDLQMMIFLYEHGADIHVHNKLNKTALEVAIENKYTSIIEQLRSWGVNE